MNNTNKDLLGIKVRQWESVTNSIASLKKQLENERGLPHPLLCVTEDIKHMLKAEETRLVKVVKRIKEIDEDGDHKHIYQ